MAILAILPPFAALPTGSSSCALCPSGAHAAALVGATSCTSCAADRLCLPGAAFPAPDRLASASAAKPRVSDPFKEQLATNDETVYQIGARVAAAFVPLVLVVISLAAASEKVPALKSWLTRSGALNWQVLDKLFREAHFKTLGNHVRVQQTPFGAAMTVACVLTFVAAGVVLGVNNLLYATYAGSVSPQVRAIAVGGVRRFVSARFRLVCFFSRPCCCDA